MRSVNTFVKTMIALMLSVALISLSVSAREALRNRGQAHRIQKVEIRVDAVTKKQVELQGKQLSNTKTEVANLAKVAARNRQLLLILLRLRNDNPQLFRNIKLSPVLVHEIAQPVPMTTVRPAVKHKSSRVAPKHTVTKPTPTTPKPTSPSPTPSVAVQQPRPTPTPASPTTPILPVPSVCVLMLLCTG